MLYTITINNLIADIKDCDWLSKNDLFVEIEFGKEKRRTTVKWDDNKPQWNESFIFNIDLNKYKSFLLTINDADYYSKNEKIISEKIKINTSDVVNDNTEYLSIAHGNTHHNLYNIINQLKADKTTLINDNKKLKDFLFGIKKNIVKVLSKKN